MATESYIYILSNDSQTNLYVGVTNNLIKRIFEHKERSKSYFGRNCNFNKLVYYEVFPDISQAILREKQLNEGSNEKKVELINRFNPNWYDLYYTIAS